MIRYRLHSFCLFVCLFLPLLSLKLKYSEVVNGQVDPTNNFPLECVIRRVFGSSRGDECMLLCPVDT